MNCPGFQDVEGGGCVHLDGLHAVADAVLHEREAEEVAIVRVYDVRSLMGWSPAFPAATPSPRARSRPLVHPARYLEDLIPVGLHELDGQTTIEFCSAMFLSTAQAPSDGLPAVPRCQQPGKPRGDGARAVMASLMGHELERDTLTQPHSAKFPWIQDGAANSEST